MSQHGLLLTSNIQLRRKQMTQTLTSTSATTADSESKKQESPEKIKTLWDSLEENADIYQKLYPTIPDGYFDGKDIDAILKKQSSNPIDRMVKKYIESPIKPYIRRRNLNSGEDDCPEKTAWEIGISISF